MAETFKIEGLDEAMRKLRALAPELQKRALRAAGTKAMRIVRDAARAGARQLDDPETASNIEKNIVTRYDGKASKLEGGSVTKVGIMGGARVRKGDNDTGHWRFLEFGTSKMRAQPFMRQALADNVQPVTEMFANSLSAAIDKVIQKAGR